MAPLLTDTSLSSRPTVDDLTGDNHYAVLARKNWLGKSKAPKVQANVVKEELWDHLEKEQFAFGSLLLLEQLQLLERYLWPGYTDNASNAHVLLLAFIANTKRREGLPVWDEFSKNSEGFSSFFRRVLYMTIDSSTSVAVRKHLITFVVGAFQSLDAGIIRKECAPLVSIGIWHNLHSEDARTARLGHTVQLGKAWRAAAKRYDGADKETQARLRFERSWLYSLVLELLNKLYDTQATGQENVLFCERLLELLADLQSQLPTRRYVNTLLQDLNLLPAIALSPMFVDEENGLLRDLYTLLKHYTRFSIEDHSGREYSALEYEEKQNTALSKLQKVALKHYKEKLTILILSNFASLGSREELEGHFAVLTDDEIKQMCSLLGFRTEYPDSSLVTRDRTFYLELLLTAHERRPPYQQNVRELTVLPTEQTVYEQTFLRTEEYNGSRPLAIPKLNLQYLTMGDFLWRSFILYRCESFYEIRKNMEDTVRRVQPRLAGTTIRFDGFSKMALPISKPAVIEVFPPKVGENHPAQVQVEVSLDVSRLAPSIRKDWEMLRQDDIVFLLAVQPTLQNNTTNGHAEASRPEAHGIKYLRCAEVMQVMDENSRMLRDKQIEQGDGYGARPRQRRLLLRLDARAYAEDKKRADCGKGDIYDSVNLIVRRQGRENNFKPVLESIKHLTLSDVPAPSWLQEVFLGYSDPAAATYQRLPNKLKSVDYRDTFLDWSHLSESLPGKTIEPDAAQMGSFPPPYVLETTTAEAPVERPTKKRRKGDAEMSQAAVSESVKVSSYKPPNNGPYPADAPKLNSVRFTPAQVEAITSGTQPGLSIVVGPPGTGKTDVATQIINNIYHNFPAQRTLLIAHSNQALNQLFQKITALDIDERHLLRLGHGEEELETEVSYSKHGRVESLLENAGRHLAEVARLAASIRAPGAHGSSCETAQYFDQVYIKPAWTQFWDVVKSGAEIPAVIEAFPFHEYFQNAPQPLFHPNSTREEIVDVASGCNRHIDHIFATLSDTRPFEILRSARDKANYLLLKEARIIAMTSTHAAMRRQEIADLGFRYDNVIMEEAAQVTEIENFIPLALQNPRDGEMKLQRVILVGDHFQNSPIVQNLAFRQYANLEQSLFLRFVRLGVPTILLDQQGRARSSLAELYKWRYPHLNNLPSVTTAPEFVTANAGFRHDYQFIDVPDYKGKGESEPSAHFIQNLGEAEYAVALYQYMRLLGYPAEKISILTTYAGQRALIRDVLNHRCKGNRLFGLPGKVSTVDKYQGEQNDCKYIMVFSLSLVANHHRYHPLPDPYAARRLSSRPAPLDRRSLPRSSWIIHPRPPQSVRVLLRAATCVREIIRAVGQITARDGGDVPY